MVFEREELNRTRASNLKRRRIIMFTCIWIALILFTAEAWCFHQKLSKRGLVSDS